MKKTIYLYKSGALLRKDSSLVLEKNNDIIYIPIEQIDTIICFSEVSLNKRVLALLNTYNVSIFFYNFYGSFFLFVLSLFDNKSNKGNIFGFFKMKIKIN